MWQYLETDFGQQVSHIRSLQDYHKACAGTSDRVDAEIIGSNSANEMDVCPRLFITYLLPYYWRCIVYLLGKRRKINYKAWMSTCDPVKQ